VISYRVTVLNASAALALSSDIVEHPLPEKNEYNDPRLAQGIADQVLSQLMAEGKDQRVILGYRTKKVVWH
jgi:alpha,alpha-trehalose phosphorylase